MSWSSGGVLIGVLLVRVPLGGCAGVLLVRKRVPLVGVLVVREEVSCVSDGSLL